MATRTQRLRWVADGLQSNREATNFESVSNGLYALADEMERYGIGGDGDATQLGLVIEGNDEGRQVLGTCSPADTITYSALLSRMQRIHDARISYVEKDAVEACMNEVRAVLGGGS